MVYLVGAVGQAQGPRHQGCPRPRGGMANLANRGAKAPTSVSDQQDSQKGLPAAVKECRGVSPPWLPGGLLEGHTGGYRISPTVLPTQNQVFLCASIRNFLTVLD